MPDTEHGQGNSGDAGGAPTDEPREDSGQGGDSDRQERRLSDENARLRIRAREAEKRIEAMESELDKLRQGRGSGDGDGDGKSGGNSGGQGSRVATLEREIGNLREEIAAERKAREEAVKTANSAKVRSTLSEIASRGRLLEADTAIQLLAGRASVAPDGEVVFSVPNSDGNGEREITASLEAVREHNLLPSIYFPPSGAPGAGGAGGSGVSVSGYDPNDFRSYEENREKVLAQKRSRK